MAQIKQIILSRRISEPYGFSNDEMFSFTINVAINNGDFFLSKVNNSETKAAIEGNNDTHCLQKRREKFPLDVPAR